MIAFRIELLRQCQNHDLCHANPAVFLKSGAPATAREIRLTAMLKKLLASAAVVSTAVIALAVYQPSAVRAAQAPAAQSAGRAERTTWYFYRVKWGFQDEFVTLFAKNHLPVLREEMKSGRIVDVRTFVPTYHGDGRADWTFAVSITYKDTAAMVGPSDEEAIVKRLFPDQATFKKEEQRRFEILDAHWDVPLNELVLNR